MRLLAGLMLASAMPAIAQAQVASEPAPQVPAQQLPATASAPATVATAVPQGQASSTTRSPVQTPPEAEDEGEEAEPDVVVTARREPGKVIGDIPPDQQLSPADVRSYGVSSVSDLLTELAPQTTSGRGGSPVILLNGRRIAGFQEIRDQTGCDVPALFMDALEAALARATAGA